MICGPCGAASACFVSIARDWESPGLSTSNGRRNDLPAKDNTAAFTDFCTEITVESWRRFC